MPVAQGLAASRTGERAVRAGSYGPCVRHARRLHWRTAGRGDRRSARCAAEASGGTSRGKRFVSHAGGSGRNASPLAHASPLPYQTCRPTFCLMRRCCCGCCNYVTRTGTTAARQRGSDHRDALAAFAARAVARVRVERVRVLPGRCCCAGIKTRGAGVATCVKSCPRGQHHGRAYLCIGVRAARGLPRKAGAPRLPRGRSRAARMALIDAWLIGSA